MEAYPVIEKVANTADLEYPFLDIDREAVDSYVKDELRTALTLHYGSIETEEWLTKTILEAINAVGPIVKHCCQLMSTVFGVHVINARVDLEHYVKTDIRHVYNQRERRIVTEVVKKKVIYYRSSRLTDEGEEIKQDHEYAFDTRTRRGLVLEHVFKILFAVQSLHESYQDVYENMVTRIAEAVQRIENGDE